MSPSPVLGRLSGSELSLPDDATGTVKIPKGFLTAIEIPDGPMKGKHAQPCICGHPIDFESNEPIHLIQWNDGRLMFCHEGCVGSPENA